MKLIKFIVPTALVATLVLCAPRADAQTMGEYAATTAGASSGASSMGTALSNSVATSVDNSGGGGSSTWGASGVGAGFDDRAGAASSSAGGGDFESRAGSSSVSEDSRWPKSGFENDSSSGGLDSDSSNRFATSTDRFADTDRFQGTSELSDSSSDRFPASPLDDHQGGLDTEYNAVNNF
ncbi:MAG: hypothetical protein WBY93_20860 [Candidatus Binatus sp.]